MHFASPASGIAGTPSQGFVGAVALLQAFMSCFSHSRTSMKTEVGKGVAVLPTVYTLVWAPVRTKCPGELLPIFASEHHKNTCSAVFPPETFLLLRKSI